MLHRFGVFVAAIFVICGVAFWLLGSPGSDAQAFAPIMLAGGVIAYGCCAGLTWVFRG